MIDPCDAKIPYRTKAAALAALDYMRKRPAFTGGLNAYPCRACGCWHLGRRIKTIKEVQKH